MKEVTLNDFINSDNVWIKRILEIENFSVERTIEKVENEYNLDKYRGLTGATIEELRLKQLARRGFKQNDKIIISLGDRLFECSVLFADRLRHRYIREYLRHYRTERYGELGCGYGYNLTLLEGETYGGDYAENAVKIAQGFHLDVCKFNFYESESYNFIRPNTTIFTHHAIEQLPDAECFIKGITAQKNKISYVVHFEPLYEYKSNFLRRFRDKYIILNDYNRNLFSLLKKNPMIEILQVNPDIIGFSPLLSTSVIAWRFRR